MNALFLLIPLGLLQVAGAAWLLTWAINRGQFEDLVGPGSECLRAEWDDDSELPDPRFLNREERNDSSPVPHSQGETE